MQKEYKYPIALTQQFMMCGNPFRADTYKGCDFGCKYCFANARKGGFDRLRKGDFTDVIPSDMRLVENFFNGKSSALNKELAKHKVPLHLGGMSDPLQSAESKYLNTLRLLELSNKNRYPVSISTKASFLENEYFKFLDPAIHTFQLSLVSADEGFIRKFETNTPLPKERIEFARHLKARGFWVSIRIQPLIDINHALEVINATPFVDYYTIEHLKIPIDNKVVRNQIVDHLTEYNIELKATGRELEYAVKTKMTNIEKIRNMTKTPLGIGDNDLHELSDNLNCCGVDLMPEAFSGWLKYNAMCIGMSKSKDYWYPKATCSSCVNSRQRKKGWAYKDYVDDYIARYGKDDRQLDLYEAVDNLPI